MLAFKIPPVLYCVKPLKKGKYVLPLIAKRAADGGIAADHVRQNGLPRANRMRKAGLQELVGETEQTLR